MSYCSNVHCAQDLCTKHDVPLAQEHADAHPVLLAVDGSPFSIYAVRWALHMFTGDFMVVHAYDYVPSGLDAVGASMAARGDSSGEYMESLRVQAELKAFRVLRIAETIFEETGRSANLLKALVVRGEARSVVTTFIKDFNVEVLVMGSRGITGFARALGSVSDFMLHHASCHVCIVHPPPDMPRVSNSQSFVEMVVDLRPEGEVETKMEEVAGRDLPALARTIYIALDGSEPAQQSYEWVRDHFLKQGDQVVLVMAYTPVKQRRASLLGWASLFGPPTYSFGQVAEEEGDKVDTVYSRMKTYAVQLAPEVKKITGINCQMCLQAGDPRDVILNITENSRQVDVLVMGSRGRGLVKRAVLGSVVDYVATHANCSIMVVK